jgi:hypothetical protein
MGCISSGREGFLAIPIVSAVLDQVRYSYVIWVIFHSFHEFTMEAFITLSWDELWGGSR